MLIGLCQLVINGMLMTTGDGEYKLASFIDDQYMSRLYEKFILKYYETECPQVEVTASRIQWALDGGEDDLLPTMQSDIMLSKESKVLIIDAKYYRHIMQTRYGEQTIRSGHLYHIFTYVKNKDAEFGEREHTVSGMLLYAQTEGDCKLDKEYQMGENKISVKTLDLSREFSEIAAQLNGIVEDYF